MYLNWSSPRMNGDIIYISNHTCRTFLATFTTGWSKFTKAFMMKILVMEQKCRQSGAVGDLRHSSPFITKLQFI